MKCKPNLLFIISFFIFHLGVCQRTLTARVVDLDTNEPVNEAIIYKSGAKEPAISNHLGYFQLEIDSLDVLTITKVGYKSGSLQIDTQDNMLIKIQKSVEAEAYKKISTDFQKGSTLNGYKKGVWEYCDKPNELAVRIDYDQKQILYIKPDSTEFAISVNGEYKMQNLDRPPRYIGSYSEFYNILARNIKYPEKARRKSKTGRLFIMFVVDKAGSIDNIEIINDMGYGFTDVLLEAFKLIPKIWIPALENNELYNSRFILPVTFQMNKNGKSIIEINEDMELPVAKKLSEIKVIGYNITKRIR